MFECHVCKKGPMTDGTTVFRVNEPGEMPAIWACREHMKAEIDPVVDWITKAIEES